MKFAVFVSTLVIGSFCLNSVEGHASLYFPTQRSRDSAVWNCGTNPSTGLGWFQNGDITGPNCGICGDWLGQASPRTNEFKGANYGWGVAEVYRQGQVLTASVGVPNPHGPASGDVGIQFRLCNDPQSISQSCFNENVLTIQSATTQNPAFQYFVNLTSATNLKIIYSYRPNNTDLWIKFQLQLPPNLVCDQCVLQMGYLGGQGGGSGVLFRSCADIGIIPATAPVQMLQNVGVGQCLSLNQNVSLSTLELDPCSNTAVGQSIFNFQAWDLYATQPSPIAFEATQKCLNVAKSSLESGASVIQYQCNLAKNQYNEWWSSIPSVTSPATFQLVSQGGNPNSPTPGNCLAASPIKNSNPPAWQIIQSTCNAANPLQLWTVVN